MVFFSDKGPPTVRIKTISNTGLIEVKFNQKMMFDDAFLDGIRGKNNFKVKYISGYLNSYESKLTNYNITEAINDKMFI